MLEMFNLKRQYENVRQELAHALYSNDAANRVVARLIFERDQARQALVNIQSSLGGSMALVPSSNSPSSTNPAVVPSGEASVTEDTEMKDTKQGLPAETEAIVVSTMQRLSGERKAKIKRKTVPEGYAASTSLATIRDSQRALLGSARTAKRGLTSLDISPNGKFCLAASNDKNVELLDTTTQSSTSLKGHKKPVFAAEFAKNGVLPLGADAQALESVPNLFVSASEDETIKIWRRADAAGLYETINEISKLPAPVVGIAVHPSGEFFAVALRDCSFAFYGFSGAEIATVATATNTSQGEAGGGCTYESLRWHPDGQLLALGTSEGSVRVWDVQALAQVATLRGSGAGVAAPVRAIDFSENGYFVAFFTEGSSTVKVWDLRKLIEAGSIDLDGGALVTAIKFDPSANYLAVASAETLHFYANKSWKRLGSARVEMGADDSADGALPDPIVAIQWDPRNGEVYTAGLDRHLRTWAPSESDAPAAKQ